MGTEVGKILVPSGVTFYGSVGFFGNGLISGLLRGSVFAQGRLEVAEEGAVVGPVEAENLQVAGEILGDVFVTGILRVMATGRIKGRITTALLSLDDGGAIDGSCSIQSSEKI